MLPTPQIQFASFIKAPIEAYLSQANKRFALNIETGVLEMPAEWHDKDLLARQYCPDYKIRTAMGNQLSRLSEGMPTASIEYFGTVQPVIHGGSTYHDHQLRLRFAQPGNESNDESSVENLRDYIVWVLFEGLSDNAIRFVGYQFGGDMRRTNMSLVQWSLTENVFYCSATVTIGLDRQNG
jgi:hypothetical protein